MLGRVGRLFDLIEEEAEGFGVAIVAAAVDEHGNTVLLMRMKGAPVHSIEMATRKAFTAVELRTDTASLTEKMQPGGPMFGLTEATSGRLVGFGGGDVFEVAPGETIGVAISGAPTETDIAIITNALEKIGREDSVHAG
jgi:uncharacterized protein GlcG (DUF336 family)